MTPRVNMWPNVTLTWGQIFTWPFKITMYNVSTRLDKRNTMVPELGRNLSSFKSYLQKKYQEVTIAKNMDWWQFNRMLWRHSNPYQQENDASYLTVSSDIHDSLEMLLYQF